MFPSASGLSRVKKNIDNRSLSRTEILHSQTSKMLAVLGLFGLKTEPSCKHLQVYNYQRTTGRILGKSNSKQFRILTMRVPFFPRPLVQER